MRPTRPVALVALGLLVGLGCTEQSEPPATPERWVLEVPSPDLSQLERHLRERMQEVRARVVEWNERDDVEPEALGEAFGALGRLYHAFELRSAAVACYDNASLLMPGDARWVYLSGLVHQYEGALDAAAEEFATVSDLLPESPSAPIRLGRVELERGRFDDARQAFGEALDRSPEQPAAIYGLGRAEAALGRDDTAVAHFERTLELQPEASVVHYALAQSYRRLGRMDAARSELARRGRRDVTYPDPMAQELIDIRTLTAFQVIQTLAADPGDVTPVELLGFTLTQLGKLEGSVAPLEDVLDGLDEADPPAAPAHRARLHYVTGGLLVFKDRDALAVAHFREAIALDPTIADAYVKLGNVLARQGDLRTALVHYDRAQELRPDDRDIALKRATALLNVGRRDEAVAALEGLLATDVGDAVVHVRLAEVLEASGQPDAAEARLREASTLDLPDTELARIHKGLGDQARRRSRFEQAAEHYGRAVELDRLYATARLDLASMLGHLGRLAEAATEFRQVASEHPRNEQARLGEITALLLDRRHTEAHGRLEEGVAAIPESETLAHTLARLLAAAPEAELRDGARALELATTACARRSTTSCAETVAMAYAEMGQFDAAVEWQGRALAALPEARSAAARSRRLDYREGRPFRASTADSLLVAHPAADGG